jgi:signal peptidase I
MVGGGELAAYAAMKSDPGNGHCSTMVRARAQPRYQRFLAPSTQLRQGVRYKKEGTFMTTLLIVVGFLLGTFMLAAIFVQVGARLVRAGKPHFGRAMAATLAIWMLSALSPIATLSLGAVVQLGNLHHLLLAILLSIGNILLEWLVIRGFIQTTTWRAALVWLFSLIPGVLAYGLLLFVLKPYVLEAFVVPSNNMAPSIIGWHTTTTCPHCQSLLIVPSPSSQEREFFPPPEDRWGICTSCFKPTKTKMPGEIVQAPDRILVNKLLQPGRWDVIEFRYPMDPSRKYIMRLVGLPGETVYIKEEEVYVNEVKIEPPEPLIKLRYGTEHPVQFGTPENPWCLGPDEYCVLGDFSLASSDSREWGVVPGANIEGVVSLCYWPVSRWKIFR